MARCSPHRAICLLRSFEAYAGSAGPGEAVRRRQRATRAGNGKTRLLRSAGRGERLERGRDEGCVSQARDAAPSRPQSRATRIASTASRKSTKPMTCLKDGDKRAAYDRFGHAAFEQGMGGGAQGFGCRFRLGVLRHLRRHLRHGRRAPAHLGPRARRGPALQHGDHARRRLPRQDRTGAAADVGDLRDLLGLGRQARHQAEDLPALRRPWPHPLTPRAASSRWSARVRSARAAAR